MTTRTFGPFTVVGLPVSTGVPVRSGDIIDIRSSGMVSFGGGLPPDGHGWLSPQLDANGDPVNAPPDYPAPHLRKNSLICQVRDRWLQGGTSARIVATADGSLVLAANDRYAGDNRGGWTISVTVTSPDVPPATNPTLRVGWVEAVQVTQRRDGSIPLVAGKATVLRIFLESGIASDVDVGFGRGLLRVDSDVIVTSHGGSQRARFTGALARPVGTHDRGDSTHAAMVRLHTPLLRPGSVFVDIRAVVQGHVAGEAGWSTRSSGHELRFVPLRREAVVPILFDNVAAARGAPTLAEYVSALNAARNCLPHADDGITIQPARSVRIAGPLDSWAAWTALLVQLATFIDLQPSPGPGPAIRTAVVHAPEAGSAGIGGIGTSFPWGTFVARLDMGNVPFTGLNLAHEFAHAYGQLHANFCGAGWPHDDRLGAMIDEPGVDVAQQTVLPTSTAELMSYCNPSGSWPSTATYGTVVDRLRP